MLSLDTPLSGLDGLCLQDFWQLPVIKDFAQPQFYLGQTVFHVTEVKGGEILYVVQIIGISWSGQDWYYEVSLPSNHPQFEEESGEFAWLDNWEIEAM